MSKIHIPKTTLFSACWGEEYLILTLKTLVASLKNAAFGKVILLVNSNNKILSNYANIIKQYNIEVVKKPLTLKENVDTEESRKEFSDILIKSLPEFCDQEYILTIQSDSCIINPEKWSDRFFEYDYVGAPWPIEIVGAIDMASNKVQINNFVGNGGFSLRSKKYVLSSLNMPTLHKNEDLNLCVFNYNSMIKEGIKFAPIDIAASFSVEHPIKNHLSYDRQFLLTYNSFGFHGSFNLAGMKYIYENSKEIL